MYKFNFKNMLESKIVVFGTILSIIAVLFTMIASYAVGYRLLKNQFIYVNKVTTSADVDKTNMYLSQISNTLNLAINNDFFDITLSDNLNNYTQIKAQNDYEAYLKRLIALNDKIDALILVDKKNEIFINIGNIVGKDFSSYKSVGFYNKVENYIKKSGPVGQMYLDRYSENNYERIAIINPIMDVDGNNLHTIVIAVLSQKISSDLSYASGSIYLSDGVGNSATVIHNKNINITDKNDYTYENALNFKGWKIFNAYKFDEIQKEINQNFSRNMKFGIIYILLTFVLLIFSSKFFVKPIKEMEKQILNIDSHVIENKPFTYRKRKVSFKIHMLLLYSIIVTLPVLWITGSSYMSSNKTINNKVGSVFENGANILYQQIDFAFNNYYKKTIEIAEINSEIQENLDEGSNINIKSKLKSVLNDLILSNNYSGRKITNISIYNRSFDLLCSSYYNKDFKAKSLEKQDKEYLQKNTSQPLWRYYTDNGLDGNSIRIEMSIRGNGTDVEAGKLLGYVFVDFESADIKQMLNNFTKYNNIGVFLTNNEVEDFIRIDGIEDQENELIKYGVNLSKQQNIERVTFKHDNNTYLMVVKQFDRSKFKLIYMLKNFNETREILYINIAILCALIFLSSIFSYGFSNIIAGNLTILGKTIRNVKAGDLGARFKSKTADEIGELGNSLNEMLDRINKMIEEKYISEVRLKDAEIKSREYELNLLQAQINPHFLYNTLKTAQYMVFAGDPRAEKMIKLLITLFRTGITRGEKLIPFLDEMKHIQTYIEIQQMRFSNKFDVTYEISDELLTLKVLKLTLQPIVENAIYHGLELMVGKGSIRIEAYKEMDMLLIKIIDTGLGMNPFILEDIKEQLLDKKASKSIGIINVNKRIKLQFGQLYGLEIDSVEGKGTTVTARFPIVKDL